MEETAHTPILKPRIGVTAEGRNADNTIDMPEEYLDAIRRAGGEPVVLAPWETAALEAAKSLDGLLLAGGGDIHPERYGSAGHDAIYGVDDERDAGELALVQMALAMELPLLGICRGAQLLNVALGGTLHEHLPDALGSGVRHRAEPTGGALHAVRVDPACRTSAALGATEVTTISWHHQAVRTVAPGLRATAWAEDGCIEAIEGITRPWLVAVQWHPELSAAHDDTQQRLFNALVAAAREISTTKQSADGRMPAAHIAREGSRP